MAVPDPSGSGDAQKRRVRIGTDRSQSHYYKRLFNATGDPGRVFQSPTDAIRGHRYRIPTAPHFNGKSQGSPDTSDDSGKGPYTERYVKITGTSASNFPLRPSSAEDTNRAFEKFPPHVSRQTEEPNAPGNAAAGRIAEIPGIPERTINPMFRHAESATSESDRRHSRPSAMPISPCQCPGSDRNPK